LSSAASSRTTTGVRMVAPGNCSSVISADGWTTLAAVPASVYSTSPQVVAAAREAALDAGVTFFDTADAYHVHADEVGHNESLIAQAIASWGGDTTNVLIATKGGHLRPGDGSWTVNGDPAYLKQAAEASLKRLGVDAIGLYQFHRPDPKVPYADSVGAVSDLLDEGKIRLAGISNANPEQIRLALRHVGTFLKANRPAVARQPLAAAAQ